MATAPFPLAGRCVLVTRPREQAGALAAAIRACGGEAQVAPLIEILPATDTRELEGACAALDTFDLAFFVSPNAVRHALAYICARRTWPTGLRVATVGGGTAAALHEAGFGNVIMPASGFDSESVLALPEFQPAAVRGRKVVVFRGDGGRPLLGATLVERGARVEFITAYRRRCPDDDWTPWVARARAGTVDALVVTSSEAVENLTQLLGRDGLQAFASVALFAPHERIASAARDAGFTQVVNTDAGDEGVLAALCVAFGQE